MPPGTRGRQRTLRAQVGSRMWDSLRIVSLLSERRKKIMTQGEEVGGGLCFEERLVFPEMGKSQE